MSSCRSLKCVTVYRDTEERHGNPNMGKCLDYLSFPWDHVAPTNIDFSCPSELTVTTPNYLYAYVSESFYQVNHRTKVQPATTFDNLSWIIRSTRRCSLPRSSRSIETNRTPPINRKTQHENTTRNRQFSLTTMKRPEIKNKIRCN
ncbi:hypothetical protein K0M31_007682 [Melipona bicolor]|uniref:Uncharacterized protein n=1 Tax=Melipona bicolor TaxID=60889 RepID=A0AA40GDA8_9HYME|nr:hypothetical protein K0M31_007682 [Melipona bicolor]